VNIKSLMLHLRHSDIKLLACNQTPNKYLQLSVFVSAAKCCYYNFRAAKEKAKAKDAAKKAQKVIVYNYVF